MGEGFILKVMKLQTVDFRDKSVYLPYEVSPKMKYLADVF